MESTASSQPAGQTLRSEPHSCLRYPNYTVDGELNDALSQLSFLQVFQPANEKPTVLLVDVGTPREQPSKSPQITFHNAEDLDKYLASNPVTGRTRFM